MDRRARMETMLRESFAPQHLAIEDDSARHAGHSGASAQGETHYNVAIVSEKFTSLSRVERSRFVHSVLKGEFDHGLHALSLSLRSPDDL